MHDILYIPTRVTALRKKFGDTLQISDGIEIQGRLFAAKSSVQIGTDCSMAHVARELANMIDLIHDMLERNSRLFRRGDAALPIRDKHPGIEYRAAFDECLDLTIAELAAILDQSTAVVMLKVASRVTPKNTANHVFYRLKCSLGLISKRVYKALNIVACGCHDTRCGPDCPTCIPVFSCSEIPSTGRRIPRPELSGTSLLVAAVALRLLLAIAVPLATHRFIDRVRGQQ